MNWLPFTKKFNDPSDKPVFTTTYIMKEGSPIVYIGHELDGNWQFMGSEPLGDPTTSVLVVPLVEIIKLDRSVLKVADLPKGYCAIRDHQREKWRIEKIHDAPEDTSVQGYHCSMCGEYHDTLPMAYGSGAPQAFFGIPEEERATRCTANNDQCIIDDRRFFIRGRIEIPVQHEQEPFCWNVWVELSPTDFERTSELWEDENRVLEPPQAAHIATELTVYHSTMGLAVRVITRPVGVVPLIELEESDHPLYLEQSCGITKERVIAFANQLLHPAG